MKDITYRTQTSKPLDSKHTAFKVLTEDHQGVIVVGEYGFTEIHNLYPNTFYVCMVGGTKFEDYRVALNYAVGVVSSEQVG